MFHKGRKVKKSKKKKIISLIVVVAVAGTSGAVVYRKVRRPVAAATEVSKVQTAEVKKGNISNTITGTGNLELDDAEAVSIPSGLTIGDVLVESGDYVSAGTVLANVDSASVQTAMDEIQSELEELDEKIRTCQEDEDANAVVSSVSGRVKAIYVEEGSDVADIITEKGALIELSLDGYMAVSIEKTDSVAAGDSVLVTLSDGTVVTGTVDTQESGSTIITVTDNGTTLGDEVSVSDSDGNVLGSGTLYIHQPFEVTAACPQGKDRNTTETCTACQITADHCRAGWNRTGRKCGSKRNDFLRIFYAEQYHQRCRKCITDGIYRAGSFGSYLYTALF